MTEEEKIKEERKEENNWKRWEYQWKIIAYSFLTVFLVQVLHKKIFQIFQYLMFEGKRSTLKPIDLN